MMKSKDACNCPDGTSRRKFIKEALLGSALSTAGPRALLFSAESAEPAQPAAGADPWYRRAYRWGQTNITEKDPTRYDIAWWRKRWRETRTQGVIINAGGIVAYYPSSYPLHHRAEFLGDRDLYGELAKAAHQDGLVVLARMDSNRASEAFYRAHPDWFAVDAAGNPYKAGDLFIACVNSPYYDEFIPAVLREIIERTRPEGVTDNSWSGLSRGNICSCGHCARKFRDKTGQNLPREKDWKDPVYRHWIQWNYARRLEIWDQNNRTTREAGGPDCLWIGMNSGSISSQSSSFRDYQEICKRAEIILLDYQGRSDATGFQANGEAGKLIHGLLGWDKLIPESWAQYQMGRPTFRLSSKPEPEARMWMVEGVAGGLQPWWHHVGAYHEDRRMYRTAGPFNAWHYANQEYLVRRRPLAGIGVVWSQRNMDFYGRDNPGELVELPYRGITQALIRARIPYQPVHVDHLERDAPGMSVLILPNLAAMSDTQADAVKRYVHQGGGLIATGETSLCDEWGETRRDYALAELFGAHLDKRRGGAGNSASENQATGTHHTYLRLVPELRARVNGPQTGTEPRITEERHPILLGFDETDILPFGGLLEPLEIEPQTRVLMTFIPAFPIFPPETAWMREPSTDIPGLVLNSLPKGGRVAFLPADIDRRFGRDNLPDHGNLLANLVRWAANGPMPLTVQGPGLIDCHLYRQQERLVLHLVNLTSAGAWRAALDELIPVGPFRVRVKLPNGIQGKNLKRLVAGGNLTAKVKNGWSEFEIGSILDHEVVVIT